MKTTEIVGFNREGLGTKASKMLRADGNVPCVLYGGKENFHFHSPVYLFKDLLYTPDAYIVNLNVEGVEKKAVLKDVQFHPVSDVILHVDFLEIFDDKAVAIDVPVITVGQAPGALTGGQVYIKNKKLRVKAIPSKLPENVEVDISSLELGSSMQVKDLDVSDYEILTNSKVSIVQIIIPRALKAALNDGDEEGATAEGEENAEATEGAEA
jgi:large subunit ribosomal protein L25